MKISTMRFIDRYVGIPLCWITGILRRFSPDTVPQSGSVLVVKFFGLGSILLTSPVLLLLKNRLPEARVVYLSFSRNKEVLDQIPYVDEQWLIDSDSAASFLRSSLAVFRRLLVRRMDVVLDFEFFSKFSTFIGALARPRMQIGFALPTNWRRWNLSHPVTLASDRHVKESFIAMLAPLGIHEREIPCPRIARLHAPGADVHLPTMVRTWHAEIICINPNAGETSLDRRWGAGRYGDTLRILLEEYPDALFCLIGSRHERDYVQRIVDRVRTGSERVVNLAGRTSLQDLLELFTRSRVLITNDSGPMHLAAAVGLSTVALFGPESPMFYGPLGNQTINLYAKLACSPCLNIYDAKVFRCPIGAKCMSDIPISRVVEATRTVMQLATVHEPEESVSL